MSQGRARQLAALDVAEKALKVGAGVCALALAGLLIWRTGLTEAPIISTHIYVPTPEPMVLVSGTVSETETDANGYILVIESTPDGVGVTVNGESKGTTPSSLNLECAPGSALKLELAHPGYQRLSRSMICRDGKMVVVRASLDRAK